jgi:hypothetical protein
LRGPARSLLSRLRQQPLKRSRINTCVAHGMGPDCSGIWILDWELLLEFGLVK